MADSISELERTSKQFRAALLAHDRATARLLIDRYGDVWANIKQRTDALNATIQQMRDAGEEVKPWRLFQQNRLGILQLQVEEEVNYYARYAGNVIADGQSTAVLMAQEHARGLVDAQMPTSYSVAAQWTRLPSESVNDLVGFLHDGAPLSNLLAQLGPEASKAIGDALIVGVATGQGPRAVARLIRDQAGMPLQRALVISRNEILRSYRTATIRNYQANSDILKGWVWHSAMDKRECGVCWSKHGSIHPIDEMFASHVQCRCSPAPVTKSWKDILGAKGEGLQETSVQVEPGADVFARLPADQQRGILGVKKQTLYESGQIQLSDLVTPTRSKVWGPGLRESNIAEALERAGARGVQALPTLPVADTLAIARNQNITQGDVLASLMKTNPPEQIKTGKMTLDEWRDAYMSDEPKGYALVHVHPAAMNLPLAAGDAAKVDQYTKLAGKSPPIIVDSNDKLEARYGGGKLDQAFGVLPHVVLDGKHRVEAAIRRGDDVLDAYVPQRKLREVWQQAHAAERQSFVARYIEQKKLTLLRRDGDDWQVRRPDGTVRILDARDIDRIAKNTGHEWRWGE